MENKCEENVTGSTPGKEDCLKRNSAKEPCKVQHNNKEEYTVLLTKPQIFPFFMTKLRFTLFKILS